MVFTDYMQNLPNERTETMRAIAKLTHSTTNSVYRWTTGKVTPPPVKQYLIAEYLGKPVEELFPPSKD